MASWGRGLPKHMWDKRMRSRGIRAVRGCYGRDPMTVGGPCVGEHVTQRKLMVHDHTQEHYEGAGKINLIDEQSSGSSLFCR